MSEIHEKLAVLVRANQELGVKGLDDFEMDRLVAFIIDEERALFALPIETRDEAVAIIAYLRSKLEDLDDSLKDWSIKKSIMVLANLQDFLSRNEI